MSEKDIRYIAENLSNHRYRDNLQAAKELIELFNKITRMPLATPDDYIMFYDSSFYTYQTWEELVKSEVEQNDGWTEEECQEQIGETIWKLPCGWWVQYV